MVGLPAQAETSAMAAPRSAAAASRRREDLVVDRMAERYNSASIYPFTAQSLGRFQFWGGRNGGILDSPGRGPRGLGLHARRSGGRAAGDSRGGPRVSADSREPHRRRARAARDRVGPDDGGRAVPVGRRLPAEVV